MKFKFMSFFLCFSLFSVLYADISAKYYNQRNNVNSDEKNWKGRISTRLTSNSPCYNNRQTTCNGRGENCYVYTYNDPWIKDPSLFGDRMIQFTYNYGIRGSSKCFNQDDKSFRHPLPVLATNSNWGVGATKWSVVWEGHVKIPSDGDWYFAMSLQGEALLEMWDKNGNKKQKYYKAIDGVGGYTKEKDYRNGVSMPKSKKGDYYKFKIKYSTLGLNQVVWFQWYNASHPSSTPKAPYQPETRFGETELGNMGVIPSNGFGYPPPPPLPQIEYRVIEKTFADVYMGTDKFDFVFNSPLRTKTAGENVQYCVLAGIKKNGKYVPATENKSVYVVFNYNKMINNENRMAITNIRQNGGSIVSDVSVVSENGKFVINSPRQNDPQSVTVNFQNPYSACFTLTGTQNYITKNGYFSVYEDKNELKNNSSTPMSSNNKFAISPAGYRLEFKANNTIIKPQGDTVYLKAGVDHVLSVVAQAKNGSDFTNLPTTHAGKYFNFVGNTKLVPILKDGSRDLVCENTNEVNLGQPLKKFPGKYGLVFYDGSTSKDYKDWFKSGVFDSDVLNIKHRKYQQPGNCDPLKDGICDTNANMFESARIWMPRQYTSVNGANKAYHQYYDVMKFKPHLVDSTWASVNFDSVANYDSLSEEGKKKLKDSVRKYGYQCKGVEKKDLNPNKEFESTLAPCFISEVIPKIVEIEPAFIQFYYHSVDNGAILPNTVSGGSGFTYINDISRSNTSDKMLAWLRMSVVPTYARPKGEKPDSSSIVKPSLQNFMPACYAKDIGIEVAYNGTKNIKNQTPAANMLPRYTSDKTKLVAHNKTGIGGKQNPEIVEEFNAYKNVALNFGNKTQNLDKRILYYNKIYYCGAGKNCIPGGDKYTPANNSIDLGKSTTFKYDSTLGYYTDYKPVTMENSVYYVIPKDAFSQKIDNGARADIVNRYGNYASVRVGFNFKRDDSNTENPFLVTPLDFTARASEGKYGTDNILDTKYRAYDRSSSVYTEHQIATMLYGRVYMPYYECQTGSEGCQRAKAYYGFYCNEDCLKARALYGGFADLFGNALPQANYFFTNVKHTDHNVASWSVKGSDAGVFTRYEAPLNTLLTTQNPRTVRQGEEIISLKNDKAVLDTIKLYTDEAPWLRFNADPLLNYNDSKVKFFGQSSSNWGGEAYDAEGAEKNDKGLFIGDTINPSSKTNRRIEW